MKEQTEIQREPRKANDTLTKGIESKFGDTGRSTGQKMSLRVKRNVS